jgi:hypothetical protein
MRCTVIFRERVAIFKIGKLDFLSDLQPRNFILAASWDFLEY